ncbi:uncharacterized protein DNG_03502 [Cephalotrichum gorgonifer]|uniref:cellulase n=1 Tax=Cephalotrichum gorgonifer TaxID=2041049 RepID=A0AAE8MUC4_9PEZI|nr:uncharacterized protein DNG_03502 [Cephalotrichum gorgonifer]
MVCDINDNPFSANQAASAPSSCGSSGTDSTKGFLCSDYQPRPVSEDLSYGFAITRGNDNCCKCFSLQWTEGPAAGKRMEVQIINEGGEVNNGRRDFILLTPGGGVGPNRDGCDTQYGYDWGRQFGGVTQMKDCESLPSHLQAGCYWRWNWARGDTNTWGVEYNQIQCPQTLTSISGCSA